MELEFELKEIKRNGRMVVYEIERKGLVMGVLYLDEPYANVVNKEMVLK